MSEDIKVEPAERAETAQSLPPQEEVFFGDKKLKEDPPCTWEERLAAMCVFGRSTR